MYIRDIITKKREKEILSEEEIRFAIQGYFKEEISDAQMSALMTAAHISGLTEQELLNFIVSMAETGEELEFYRISSKITDIHVLGGISDKIILILLSVIHSLGYPVAKVIGRELGMEDRLLTIPGFRLEENVESFTKSIEKNGFGILKSIKNLAPVEDKLYMLRHDIACDNDLNLIAASIMSQKLALGFYNIFFEITYGPNAYVKTFENAKLLAKYLTSIGKKEMRNVGCAITPLNEPVGKCFGNSLELREVYKFLRDEYNEEIEEVVLNFGANILAISGFGKDLNKNRKMIKENIESGRALESFEKIISYYGGNLDFLKGDIVTKFQVPIISSQTGYISEIDVNGVRQLAKYLNAIRSSEITKIEEGAGIIFNKKVGDGVNNGEILGYIHTNDETKINRAVPVAKELFKFSDKKVKNTVRVEYNINNK